MAFLATRIANFVLVAAVRRLVSHATTANIRRSCTRHRLSRWGAKFGDTTAGVLRIHRGDFQSPWWPAHQPARPCRRCQCVRGQEFPPCICTPQSADKAISQRICKMGIELAGPFQTSKFGHVGGDRFSLTLIPLVEPILFSIDKWFHCEMSFESRAEFRKRLFSWGIRGQQILQQFKCWTSERP